MRKSHKRIAAGGLAIGLVLGGTAAYAYWTGGGSGTATSTTKSGVTALAVNQTPATTLTLAPGESVALAGTITNPNNTDVRVGALTGVIRSISTSANPADFSITGGPVNVNAVVKKGTPVAWSGLNLVYANSAVNQDNGKSATVTVDYTLAAFTEPPSTGTMTYVAQVLTISDVAVWPTATGNYTPVATDKLGYMSGGICITVTGITQSVVGGVVNATSAPYGYYNNGPLALKHTNGTCDVRSPVWNPLAP